MSDPFLVLSEITRKYPGVTALDGVSLSVSAGEVIGLVGENGAGKSTLMKVLGGVVAPTSGTVMIDGQEQAAFSVAAAMAAGIAFVHQELNLFDNLDVAANIFIGREPLTGGRLRLVDRRKLAADVQPLLDELGVDFTASTPVSSLSIAQRQLLEIAKALSMKSRLVIMDEPTSSLSIAETGRLMTIIGKLRAGGVSVIFISHRLNELVDCADRVLVLRDGKTVGHLAKAEISHAAMIRLMIGRDLKSLYIKPKSAPGAAALQLRDVRTKAFPKQHVTLDIHCGEIVGLAGLVGAGRTELARAVFGIDPVLGGEVLVAGAAAAMDRPETAIEAGIFLVPEDRKQSGLLLDLPIAANIVLPDLWRFARKGLVRDRAVRAEAEAQRRQLDIRATGIDEITSALSGGNQQKVVLAKWLSLNPKVLICDEPTRGVDVGAKQDIYAMLRGLADNGVAILMISSDMEEVIGVSDRIVVMHEGGISGRLERADFSEHNVLTLAVGSKLQQEATA